MNHAQELITILVAPSFEVVVACTRACAAAGIRTRVVVIDVWSGRYCRDSVRSRVLLRGPVRDSVLS